MSPLMRITGALFVSAALGGCASMKEPVKPEFVSSPDGCGVMNKNTGQLISMSIECLAQKQLEAEKQAAALQRKAELEAMANLTSTIIKQPVSKDNPQAQNMGVVLGILKMEEVARQSGLDKRDLKETLPGGWTPRMIETAARLVRGVFNGRCSRDVLNNQDLCWDAPAKEEPKAAAPAASAPQPAKQAPAKKLQ